MKNKIMDFEDRFILRGARFLTKEEKCCQTDYGYRIVKGQRECYLSAGTSRTNKYHDFMLQITSIVNSLGRRDVLEQDIVDYRKLDSDERRAGVICYDKQKFCFAVMDTFSKEMYPLFECKVIDVLGNIYEHTAFLSLSLPNIYKKLGRAMVSEEKKEEVEPEGGYAYIEDEEIPGITDRKPAEVKAPISPAPITKETQNTAAAPQPVLAKPQPEVKQEVKPSGIVDVFCTIDNSDCSTLPGWEYILRAGTNSKQDKGSFRKEGNYAYYEVAVLAIALSNVKKAKVLRIHAGSDVIPTLLSGGLIEKFAQNNWRGNNGEPLKNTKALQSLKEQLDRLSSQGASYEVLLFGGRKATNIA